MTGAIFFDRDNTLVKDHGYTWKLSDFAFLLDSAEALAFLHSYKNPVNEEKAAADDSETKEEGKKEEAAAAMRNKRLIAD